MLLVMLNSNHSHCSHRCVNKDAGDLEAAAAHYVKTLELEPSFTDAHRFEL